MQISRRTRNELISVATYLIIVILAILKINFFVILTHIALPVLVFYLIYLEIKSERYNLDKFLSIFTLIYKILIMIGIYFNLHHLPGTYILLTIALVMIIIYICYIYIKHKNEDLANIAYIYFIIFCSIIIGIGF